MSVRGKETNTTNLSVAMQDFLDSVDSGIALDEIYFSNGTRIVLTNLRMTAFVQGVLWAHGANGNYTACSEINFRVAINGKGKNIAGGTNFTASKKDARPKSTWGK